MCVLPVLLVGVLCVVMGVFLVVLVFVAGECCERLHGRFEEAAEAAVVVVSMIIIMSMRVRVGVVGVVGVG